MSHNDDQPTQAVGWSGYDDNEPIEYGAYDPDLTFNVASNHSTHNQRHQSHGTQTTHNDYQHKQPSHEDILDRVFAAHPELNQLPPHACTYCGIHDINCVAQCSHCDRWFCNEMGETKASHLITHLVRSHHRSFRVHPKSDNHDVDLECLFCRTKNIFLLGTMNAKEDNVVALVCRTPCALLPKVKKMFRMAWTPLIKNKSIVRWLLPPPSDTSLFTPIPITAWLITQLEDAWRTNPSATLNDLYIASKTPPLEPVPQKFIDATHYHDVMLHLVNLEAETDRVLKTAQSQTGISVQWSESSEDANFDIYDTDDDTSHSNSNPNYDHGGRSGRGQRQLFATFTFFQNEETSLKVVHGDELVLTYGDKDEIGRGYWEGEGYVVSVTLSGRVVVSIKQEFTADAPTDAQHGYTVQPKWNSTSYKRMEKALERFSRLSSDDDGPSENRAMSQNLYLQLLGHTRTDEGLDIIFPDIHKLPRLPALNEYQINAVRESLTQTLSLLQGPPGTGKTTTCAYLVYNLYQALYRQHSSKPRQILVCAPSNVAVDHLTEKIHLTGLKVVRVVARSRQDISSTVDFLSLHTLIDQMAERSSGKFSALHQLERTNPMEMNKKMRAQYMKLLHQVQIAILNNADVICTTCTTIGSDRLFDSFEFHHVLIDEATQCREPEILIPLTRRAKQVILVGDHCQLGPVVMSKQAARAGFNRSIFERLLLLGHVPKVLQIQYRMHPALAAFPSNTFYDGTLLNGITESDRAINRKVFPWPNPDVPMAFIAATGIEEFSASGSSFLNRHETSVVEKVLHTLIANGVQPGQIGIITPYEGQRLHIVTTLAREDSPILALLRNNFPSNNNSDHDALVMLNNLEIASVDSFQGREKDFIIFTCVRSNDNGEIGFLSDPRRQNVALTRARYGLIMTGNPRILARQPLWHALLCHFKHYNTLVEGTLPNIRPSSIVLPPPTTFISARSVRIPIGFDPNTSFGMKNAVDYSRQVIAASRGENGKQQQQHQQRQGGRSRRNQRHNILDTSNGPSHQDGQFTNVYADTANDIPSGLFYKTDEYPRKGVDPLATPAPAHTNPSASAPSTASNDTTTPSPPQHDVFHFDPGLFDVSASNHASYIPLASAVSDAFVPPITSDPSARK